MKLIIDIPEWLYDNISEYPSRGFAVSQLESAILHGTPIPDNATNGDMIRAIFPQWKLMENTFEEMVMFDIPMKDGYLEHNACSKVWWKEPYQKGGKE